MDSKRLVLIDNDETSMPKRQEQVYRPARREVDPAQGGLNDGTGFRCITCNRGPPYTKKYAKNQCQTCYKKDKKFQRVPVYPYSYREN